MRILVAEDEAIAALDVQYQLKQVGYDVLPAVATGEEAIARAEEEHPDLVLMDIQLSGEIDGIEAARRLNENLDIPVVFLTANSDPVTMKRVRESDPFGFILKPFEPRELYTVIEMAALRHRLQQQLAESERRWQTTLRSLGEAVVSTNSGGVITFVNPEAERLSGWSASEVLGQDVSSVYRLLDEKSGEALQNPVDLIIRGGESATGAKRPLLLRKDGQTVPVAETAALMKDENDRALGAVWVLRDIREARQAEEKLLRAKEKYLSLLEGINDGFFVTDETGTLTFANKACAAVLGARNTEDILGKNISEFISPRFRDQWQRQFLNAVNQGVSGAPLEVPVPGHVDRQERLLEIKASPVRAAGQVLGLQGIVIDVTERKRSEALLKEAEERFNIIVQSTGDAIIMADDDRNITFWNAAASRIFGYELDDVLGQDLLHFVVFDRPAHSSQKKSNTDPELDYYDYGNPITQMCAITRDGVRCPVEVSFSSIQLRGEWHTVLICRDIRERKRAEEQLNKYRNQLEDLVRARTEELSRANQQLRQEMKQRIEQAEEKRKLEDRIRRSEKMESLGMLAGGVAHDLNNMLGPLIGYPELILDKLPEDSPAREMVRKMRHAATDAAAIVDDLLTLSRRGRCKLAPTNLNEVIERYLASPGFEALASESPGVKIHTRLDETVPTIRGSAHHLLKLLMNLVGNGYEAMHGQGDLTIQTSCARLKKLIHGYENVTPGDYILLRVRDTGVGIEADKVKRIFEPYYSTKELGRSGTGLGLAVVYGVVKDHGGYYDIFSRVGHGTEFVFYFPACSPADDSDAEQQAILGGQERILVVDDDEEQREFARQLLRRLGYDVYTTANGHEAIEFLQDHQVDLVVMDMIMEADFDGLDTYMEMVRLRPNQKTVIISGHSPTERVRRMQELGAGPCVRKPFDIHSLGNAVKKLLPAAPPLGVSTAAERATGSDVIGQSGE